MEAAWTQYRDSWPDWGQDQEQQGGGQTSKKAAWYFSAAQLTYNSTAGDWASTDKGVLERLFARFKAFLLICLAPFKPKGISATMERSTGSYEHVHLHAYFHSAEPFRGESKDAVSVFIFTGIDHHHKIVFRARVGGK